MRAFAMTPMRPIAAAVLLLSGCAPRLAPQNPHSINARAELVVRMPAKDAQPFIDALQRRMPDRSGTSVNVSEWTGGYGSAVATGANAYDLAVRDAQRKAAAIAQSLHQRIASLQSVVEFSGPVPAAPAPPEALNVQRVMVAMPVNVRSGQAVALAMSYLLSNGTSIAVFGLATGAPRATVEGVSVDLNANGSAAPAAQQSIGALETFVRDQAQRFGLPSSAVSIESEGFQRF